MGPGVDLSRRRAAARAEREAAAAAARQDAERRRLQTVARTRRRTGGVARVRRTLGLSAHRVDSATRRARARQWAPIVAFLFVLNVVGWVLWTSWSGRALLMAVTLAVVPLIAVWLADAARGRKGGYGRRP